MGGRRGATSPQAGDTAAPAPSRFQPSLSSPPRSSAPREGAGACTQFIWRPLRSGMVARRFAGQGGLRHHATCGCRHLGDSHARRGPDSRTQASAWVALISCRNAPRAGGRSWWRGAELNCRHHDFQNSNGRACGPFARTLWPRFATSRHFLPPRRVGIVMEAKRAAPPRASTAELPFIRDAHDTKFSSVPAEPTAP